jgi:PAS domain S-box-containing protein
MLRQQREAYESLLDAQNRLGEGVAVFTLGGRMEYANEALARITGRSMAELLTSDRNIKDLYAPGELQRLALEVPLFDPAAVLRYRTKIPRPDGTVCYVDVSSAPVRLRNSPVRVAVLRDITAEVAEGVRVGLDRQRLANSERMAALGSLASGIAHELRTPLTVIQTNMAVLSLRASRAHQTGDARDLITLAPGAAREIETAVDRANHLIRSLGRFLHGDQGPTVVFDPTEALQDAMDLFASANRGQAEIRPDFRSVARIRGDPVRLQQIILNLLWNAVEATLPEAAPIDVSITAAANGNVMIEVLDRGRGMDESTKARMWDPFFTTKPNGMGLGLSIVKAIIEDMGGTVDCESAPGQGTRIRMEFPPAGSAG